MRKCTVLMLTLWWMTPATAQTKPAAQPPAPEHAHTAAPAKSDAPLPSEQTVEGFLKRMFGYDPNISWKIAEIKASTAKGLGEVTVVLSNGQGQQVTRLFITPDGEHALAGDLIPFGADPFAKARGELERRAHGPARGPADASVTIVEFADLQCPACKAAYPIMEKLLEDEPNARFVFQQFPLVQIHKWALKAATYGECIARQDNDKFWHFVKQVYDNQEQINEGNVDVKLKDAATTVGADPLAATLCAAEPATEAKVKESMELGKSLNLTGTPTVFIGGRQIQNISQTPYDVLKAIVEWQGKK